MRFANEWLESAPRVIAHRGASAYAPENTLSAFRMAVAQGAHAVEMDAKLTKDHAVVILHDATLERTTSGHGALHEHTYREIRQLDAGSHFSEDFRQERIPTLEEVLEAVGEHLLLNIELTNYARPLDALPELAAEIVHQFGLENRTLFSSFSPLALIKLRKIHPEMARALLVHPREPKLLRWLFQKLTRIHAFHPHFSLVTPAMISYMRSKMLLTNTWTVNDPESMAKFFQWSVDGVITDYPDLALQAAHQATQGS